MNPIIFIDKAKYIDGYKILLEFNDGKENTIDFELVFLFMTCIKERCKYYKLKYTKNDYFFHFVIKLATFKNITICNLSKNI